MKYEDFVLLHGEPECDPLEFEYKGEARHVVPISIKGTRKGWSIFGFDVDKGDYRQFRLDHIALPAAIALDNIQSEVVHIQNALSAIGGVLEDLKGGKTND